MEEKHFCRNCKGLRNHKQIHEVTRNRTEEDGIFLSKHTFSIIECLGCETLSFLEVYSDTEMTRYIDDEGNTEFYDNKTIYPFFLETSSLQHTHLLPSIIREIYDETIEAFKSDSRILAAGGLRAIIEATCNNLKIKKSNLEKRIDLLYKGGYLTLDESKRIHSVRFLGNDALHVIEKPKKRQLYVLLEIVNHLLSNLFISDKTLSGEVDTVIDRYDHFVNLVASRINDEMVDQEFTIEQIVGNSQRRVPRESFKDFVQKFKKETESNEYNFVTVRTDGERILFKIIQQPSFKYLFF